MLFLNLNRSEEFLREILHHRDHLDTERIRTLYQELGDQEAFDVCQKNMVTGIAYDALKNCSGIELSRGWNIVFSDTESLISEYMSELDKIANILHLSDIPMVALKNSGIARGLYQFYGSSPMGDLDVLVKRSDFRKAHKILLSNGYVMKFRSPLEEEDLDLAEKKGGAEYSVTLDSGKHLWFELQWRPISGRWIRPDQEPSTDQLIKRSKEIKGSFVRLLSSEDNLMQVALHTAKHTYVRAPGFRLHTDVDRVVRSSKLEWNKFSDMVLGLQVKTPVFLSLALAHDLLGTPIPDEVFKKIHPGKFKTWIMVKWLEKVGLFFPDEKKWGRLGYILFVSLMYDDFSGLFKSIFPPPYDMKAHYGYDTRKPIFWLYILRIIDLVKNRVLVK